jgi:class 3 adenylate cyclase/tetratricopeptide (TPR) repeat protein
MTGSSIFAELSVGSPVCDSYPMAICAACGHENRPGARFCDACGAPLAQEEVRELRKVVTILFCDVTGSTALGERLDAESLRGVMERYFSLAREVLERHGGTVEKFIGDAVMAVFGIPVVHEDDALRATRAADELRARLGELNVDLQQRFETELQVRIGVNTGEVVTNEGGTLATGDAVNVAARLEQAASPGEILIGDATRRLAETALELEPAPPVDAKGKSELLVAFRLLSVRADAPAFERRFDAPFVGREGEVDQLTHAYSRAVRDSSCQLFTVLGPAGIGKSRLVHEFVVSHSDAVVLRGRCLAYGEGITYFPLVEMLEQLAAEPRLSRLVMADPESRALLNTISSTVGLADEAILSREDTFRAVRRLLENLARSQPLVAIFDDIHWAEPTLLDLIDHVGDWSREAPILLLCMARPELLDSRPGWGGGKLNASSILLEPLSHDESESLMDGLLTDAQLSVDLRERIAAAAEGNPLFVEQMLALLEQEGGTNGDRDVVIPPTIQALLATRLEQLPSGERVAAERASVIGKEFWRTALAEIGGEVAALPALVRKELIRPYRSPVFPTDDAFRFRHQLIRDAAYAAMPKALRAELHEQFGRWLELNRSEYDEIVGYHFEQAYRLKEQLAPVDDGVTELATRAGQLLGAAGHRAFERGDNPAAVALLSRATTLLPPGSPRRVELLVELGYVLNEAGQLDRSSEVFSETTAEAAEAGLAALESRARIGCVYTAVLTGDSFEHPLETVRAEIDKLEELGDDAGLAEGWQFEATLQSWLGRSQLGGESYARSAEHALRVGNRRITAQAVAFRVLLQAWGCTPAAEGERECAELIAEHAGTSIEPHLRIARGLHLSFLGREEESRQEHEAAEELFRQFGNELMGSAARMSGANAEIRAGRFDVAEAAARDGIERLERLGDQGFLSSTFAQLAEALYRAGRYDEAEAAALRTKELAMSDDFDARYHWRTVVARVLARRGDFAEAETLAREAVEIVDETDWFHQRGEAAAALAEILELGGRTHEARAAYEQARSYLERKQALADLQALQRRLDALAG